MVKTSAKAPKAKAAAKESAYSGANLGFEAKLWLAADKLRDNMDAAEYKHVVLGLIFLKYISDTSDEHHAKQVKDKGDCAGAHPEDKDKYKVENVFWVPKEARRAHLQAPTVGKVVDDAVFAIERDKPRLKGVLPKECARPGFDKHRLGDLIDLLDTIGLGDRENGAKDNHREALLAPIDPLLEQYESEYYYIFKRVYEASQPGPGRHALEHCYSMPNIARRLVEAFLSFRFPVFTGKLEKQLDTVAFDPAKKARILRFLHTHSHHGYVEESGHDLSTLAETSAVLIDVLAMIEATDAEHYRGMKELACGGANTEDHRA